MVPESSLMSVYRDINQSLTFVEACSPQHLTILMGGKKTQLALLCHCSSRTIVTIIWPDGLKTCFICRLPVQYINEQPVC